MPSKINPPFRADHIGSLLRPPELLAARQSFADGKLSGNPLGPFHRTDSSRAGALEAILRSG